jgi:hypothetical protein
MLSLSDSSVVTCHDVLQMPARTVPGIRMQAGRVAPTSVSDQIEDVKHRVALLKERKSSSEQQGRTVAPRQRETLQTANAQSGLRARMDFKLMGPQVESKAYDLPFHRERAS